MMNILCIDIIMGMGQVTCEFTIVCGINIQLYQLPINIWAGSSNRDSPIAGWPISWKIGKRHGWFRGTVNFRFPSIWNNMIMYGISPVLWVPLVIIHLNTLFAIINQLAIGLPPWIGNLHMCLWGNKKLRHSPFSGMVPWMDYAFPFSWECHDPNWRTHICQRASNHQPVIVCICLHTFTRQICKSLGRVSMIRHGPHPSHTRTPSSKVVAFLCLRRGERRRFASAKKPRYHPRWLRGWPVRIHHPQWLTIIGW